MLGTAITQRTTANIVIIVLGDGGGGGGGGGGIVLMAALYDRISWELMLAKPSSNYCQSHRFDGLKSVLPNMDYFCFKNGTANVNEFSIDVIYWTMPLRKDKQPSILNTQRQLLVYVCMCVCWACRITSTY